MSSFIAASTTSHTPSVWSRNSSLRVESINRSLSTDRESRFHYSHISQFHWLPSRSLGCNKSLSVFLRQLLPPRRPSIDVALGTASNSHPLPLAVQVCRKRGRYYWSSERTEPAHSLAFAVPACLYRMSQKAQRYNQSDFVNENASTSNCVGQAKRCAAQIRHTVVRSDIFGVFAR